MRAPNWLACLGPISLFALTLGCGPEATTNPNVTTDPGTPAPAYVNLVNLTNLRVVDEKQVVTDVSAVDLYIDKQKAVSSLDYRKSSGNLKITPAMHSVELRAVGAAANDTPLLTANVVLQPGSRTLLAAVGRRAESDGASKLQLIAAPYGVVDSTSVKVRVFNAAPESPALDLAAGNNAVASGAAFGSASGYGSVALLPAATKLGLRLGRTTDDLALVTLPAMATPGSVLTVIALGEMNPTADDKHALSASVLDEGSGALIDLPLVINDSGPKGAIYLMHAAPDSPAIDVVDAQGTKIITNVAYRQASPLGELAAGQSIIDLRPTGTSATVLQVKLKMLPTLSWAMVLHGSVALGTATPLQARVLPRALGAPTSWRVVHAVADVPAFTVAAAQPIVARLVYGQSSPLFATALPAPTLSLRLFSDTKQGFDVNVPQSVLDMTKDQLVTLVATGTARNAMQPFGVLAVLDSTATATTAPTILPLVAAPAAMLAAPRLSAAAH